VAHPKHSTNLPVTVCDIWDQPAKAADFIYCINYEITLPDNMTIDNVIGYNNNNNNTL